MGNFRKHHVLAHVVIDINEGAIPRKRFVGGCNAFV